MNNNYIIGGGLSGLIFAFYNSDYKIVSSSIGGQVNSIFDLGPRILEVDKYSTQLLKDLNILNYTIIKECKIGYYYNNEFIDRIDDNFKNIYNLKTRGFKQPESSILSSNSNIIKYYNISLLDLSIILKNKLSNKQIIEKNVTFIDTINKQFFIENKSYSYSNLVIAISRKIYNILSNTISDFKFETYNKIFALVDNFNNYNDNYNYIYYINCLYHRVLKWGDDRHVLEFTNVTEEQVKKYCKIYNYNIVSINLLKDCQIRKSHKFTEISNINFIGRYANWRHNLKINDVIKRSIECKKIGDLKNA